MFLITDINFEYSKIPSVIKTTTQISTSTLTNFFSQSYKKIDIYDTTPPYTYIHHTPARPCKIGLAVERKAQWTLVHV